MKHLTEHFADLQSPKSQQLLQLQK